MSNFLERARAARERLDEGHEYETENGLVFKYRVVPAKVLLIGKGIVPDNYNMDKYRRTVKGEIAQGGELTEEQQVETLEVMEYVIRHGCRIACTEEEYKYVAPQVDYLSAPDMMYLYALICGADKQDVEESFRQLADGAEAEDADAGGLFE